MTYVTHVQRIENIMITIKNIIRTTVFLVLLVGVTWGAARNHSDQVDIHKRHQHLASSRTTWSTRIGVWGSWSNWSACSRTCGRGVSTQSRECLVAPRSRRFISHRRIRTRRNHKRGKGKCLGVYKRFQLCNLKPCKLSLDHRKEQCATFDGQNFRGRYYRWVPYIKEIEKCELHCRPVGYQFYARLAKIVEDGTSCSAETSMDKVCIAGHCKTVGCDGVLGSEKTLDQCGVCGGDNSTCRIVSGLFTRPNLRTGYNLIARIPRGACNINVTELKHSQNHLAIRTNSGEYVINGNWNINWSGTYNAAGTTFFYTRRNHITQQMENIVAKGPINQDVQILLVMYKTNNPGIKYEYMLPLKERSTLSPPNFRPISSASSSLPTSFPSWRTPGSFSMRGAHQGRDQSIMALEPGTYNKNRRPRTRNRQANREDSMTHPYLYQRTSTGLETPFGNTNSLNVRYDIGKKNADVFEWKVSGLTECSESCGGGKQSTLIVCRRRDNLVVVHDHYCNPLHKLKLQTFQCNTHPCPASWFPGDWGPCSTTCGDGTQTRDVTCKQRVSPRVIMKVTERACFDLEKPLSKQMCRVQTCVHWKTADWGECSTHCGKGMRKRQVRCVTQDSEAEVPESKCTDSKPDNEEMCDMGPCDNAWFFSPWTESCSAECGAGVQSRKVLCLQGTTNDSVKGTCDTSTRPKETRPCPSTKGCDGQWFTGSWSQCSETCGPGKKKREVICMTFTRGQWYSALDINCHKKKKPDTTEACNQKACGPEWYTTSWTECSRSCNTGVQSREVSCVSENQQISQECPVGTKPALRKACSTQECPGSNIASGCVDQFKNCDLVVQSRLCRYSYYRQICCNSCHGMR